MGEQLVEGRHVVGPHERLRVTDPHRAVGADGVVDEVAQRLRHGGARHARDERVELGGGPAEVEGAAYGGRREAVDRGAAARLHLGGDLQPPGQVGLEGARGDRGQVGLQQDVVDRLGQQRRQGRGDVVAGQQRPRVRRHPAEGEQPQRGRLAQRPGDLVAAGAGPARPQPVQPLDERGRPGAGRPAPVPGGSAATSSRAIRRVSAAKTLVFSGDSAVCARPTASRWPTSPASREVASQARASVAQRSAAGRRVHASNSSVGANTALPSSSKRAATQPGLGGDLDQRARRSARRRGAARPRLELADAQSAARAARPAGGRPSGRAAAPAAYDARTPPRPRSARRRPRRARPWPASGPRRRARAWCGRRAGRR